MLSVVRIIKYWLWLLNIYIISISMKSAYHEIHNTKIVLSIIYMNNFQLYKS